MRSIVVAGFLLLLVATLVGSAEGPASSISSATDLLAGPDGSRLAVLLPGAAVRVVETRDGWAHVVVEGWIRSDEAAAAPPAAAPAPAPAPATPEAPVESASAAIAGSIFVTEAGGRTAVGSGIAVRLIADPQAATREIAAIRAACDGSRASLQAESEALRRQGEKAMSSIENPSRAFEAYDEAKRRRAGTIRELKALDADCDARVEKSLDERTTLRALSTPEGRFLLDGVPPGRYTLHAAFESNGVRHAWDVEVTPEAGARISLDLTNANRTRSEPLPRYR